MLALLPEVQFALRALKRSKARNYNKRFFEAIMTAYKASLTNPELAQSINDLMRKRFEAAARQLQAEDGGRRNFYERSDNQTPDEPGL
jgi:hypothetical protein